MRDQLDVKTMNQGIGEVRSTRGGTLLYHRYLKLFSRCVNDERFSSFFHRSLYTPSYHVARDVQTMKDSHLFHIVSKLALRVKNQRDSLVLHRSLKFSLSVVLRG